MSRIYLGKTEFTLQTYPGDNKLGKVATYIVPKGMLFVHDISKPWALLFAGHYNTSVTTAVDGESVTITPPLKVAVRDDVLTKTYAIMDGTTKLAPSTFDSATNSFTFAIPTAGTHTLDLYYIPGEGEYFVTIEIPTGTSFVKKIVFNGDIGILNLRNPLKGKEALYVTKHFSIAEDFIFNIEVKANGEITFDAPIAILKVPFIAKSLAEAEEAFGANVKELIKNALLNGEG